MKRFFTSLSIFISLCLFVGVCSPAVYAENVPYNDFWAYYYIEEYCGVDFSQYQETDNGSSFWDIVERYGTNSIESTMNLCTDSVKNTMSSNGADEWAINQVDVYADYAKDVLQNNITTSQAVVNYTQEKLSRTVVAGKKVFLNVSGNGFWDSIYNDLFNNGGYEQQYETTTNDTYHGTYNDKNYSFRLIQSKFATRGSVNTSCFIDLRNELYSPGFSGSYYGFYLAVLTPEGEFYSNWQSGSESQFGGCTIASVSIDDNSNTLNVVTTSNFGTGIRFSLQFNGSSAGASAPEPGGDQIPKPKSCGVINLNGDWVDVPVNPEDRPPEWDLNEDGTVTIDGQDYPIYIEIDSGDDGGGSGGGDGGGSGDGGSGDDGQLTPDGMFQIIKTIGNTPFGNIIGNDPNEQYNQPDGNNNNNPFGLDIGGFFSNIAKAIANALKAVFKNILGTLTKLLSFLADIIKGSWVNNLRSPNFDTMFDFGLIQTMVTKFFEALGVEQ